MNEKINFLKKVNLFYNVDEKHLSELLQHIKIDEIREGDIIIQEGEIGDSMFVLFEGIVIVKKKMTLLSEYYEMGEVEKSLIRLKAEDFAFFGEMVLCGDSYVRSATVIADTKCILGVLPAILIKNLIQKSTEFGAVFYHNLARVLADRLRKANKDILKLTTVLTLALEE